MNENLTILKKGLILIAIPFLAQVIFIGLLLKTNADSARAQRWALHTKDVIAQAEATFRRLIEGHSAIRGLILTGDPIFSTQVELALARLPHEIKGLEKLVQDNSPQYTRVLAIAAKADELITWQKNTLALVQAGNRAEALERVKDLSGKSKLDEVRVRIDEFLRVETRLDLERTTDLMRTAQHQAWAIAAGGLIAVLGAIVLATIFAREINRRFATLAENAKRLAEGKELERPLEGRDEIAQLDRVFHSMARAIAEKNRENEMFIYSVSHDLRSPLVNLQGFSQELGHAARELRGIVATTDLPESTKRQALALVDQDISSSIQFIQTAVSRLSIIIDSLLRLSRAGRVEYRWQAVDVNSTVGRVVEALGSTIGERKAQVTVTSPQFPDVWGDPTAIEQVFANLVGNALNYLDPQRPGLIEVGTLDGATGSVQTYYVKDNGRGIPETGMAKLFHVFQRFHENAARGEGIGLALVRRIVERHGGKIRVESQVGQGSTFFVDLPTQPPEPNSGGFNASPNTFEQPKGSFA